MWMRTSICRWCRMSSSIQRCSGRATNALDTLLVQQGVARHFLAALVDRMLVENKVEVRGCSKTMALMGQMAVSGHISVVPATEEDWHPQFQTPTLAVKMVVDLDEALADIAEHGPCLTAVIATTSYASALRFTREVDAGAVFVNASSRLNAADSYGRHRIGAQCAAPCQGSIGLEQFTCEKYVAFGTSIAVAAPGAGNLF